MAELISNINFWLLFAALLVWVIGFAIVLKPEIAFLKTLPLAWNGRRTIGFVVVTFGLDLCAKALHDEILFPFSTFFLMAFLFSMGSMTVLGRPFLSQSLIPESSSKRVWLGASIVTMSIVGYVLILLLYSKLSFDLLPNTQLAIVLGSIFLGIQFFRLAFTVSEWN